MRQVCHEINTTKRNIWLNKTWNQTGNQKEKQDGEPERGTKKKGTKTGNVDRAPRRGTKKDVEQILRPKTGNQDGEQRRETKMGMLGVLGTDL